MPIVKALRPGPESNPVSRSSAALRIHQGAVGPTGSYGLRQTSALAGRGNKSQLEGHLVTDSSC